MLSPGCDQVVCDELVVTIRIKGPFDLVGYVVQEMVVVSCALVVTLYSLAIVGMIRVYCVLAKFPSWCHRGREEPPPGWHLVIPGYGWMKQDSMSLA